METKPVSADSHGKVVLPSVLPSVNIILKDTLRMKDKDKELEGAAT